MSGGTPPAVSVGAATITEVHIITTAGSGDHLKFTVPAANLATAGAYQVRTINPATGATAVGPGGSDSILLEVIQ